MATSRKSTKTKQVNQPKWRDILVSLALGVMLTLMGLVLLVAIVRVNVLTCTRLEPSQYSCALESRLLAVLPLSSTPLPGLRGARVAQELSGSTYEDSKDRTRTSRSTFYWVALITNEGEVALDTGKSGWIGSKQQTADRINAFIRSRVIESFQAQGDLTSLLFILGPLLALIPGLWLLIGTAKEIGTKFTYLIRGMHKLGTHHR